MFGLKSKNEGDDVVALRTICEEQRRQIDDLKSALEAANAEAAKAKSDNERMLSNIERLQNFFDIVGVDVSGIADGSAMWPTKSAKLLSVELVTDRVAVAERLPDAPETTRDQILLAAKSLMISSSKGADK
jgi:hypothetical protein